MIKGIFNKFIRSTECYENLRKRYQEVESAIKRITKIRNNYKQGVKDIKNILKGYKQKSKQELLECIAKITEICKEIGE